MRDIVEYPITAAEIVECCRRTSRELEPGADGGVGDMDPLLLAMAADIVEAAAGMLEGGIEENFGNEPDYLRRYVTPWDRAIVLIRAFQVAAEQKKPLAEPQAPLLRPRPGRP